MRIKSIQLKHFKRFDDLTINLGDNPKKIIALVGPNGCGKSSIFDAFEEIQKNYKAVAINQQLSDVRLSNKWLYKAVQGEKSNNYNKNESIKIISNNKAGFDVKSFYIRSAYRFTSQLNVSTIRSMPDVLGDEHRPATSSHLDTRLLDNYERLLNQLLNEYQYGDLPGREMRNKLLGRINNILSKIIDIKISDLGDVMPNKGKLCFEKETSKDLPYEILSAGEKEVVDIVIDLIIKIAEFDDTVYCIDEPELHLNTAIQRKLLIEIEKLIPDNCQLWIATHSIGFLRALQEDLKDKCSIIDFSEKDYFNSPCLIEPMPTTRKNWQRVFQTALEDLTGLLAPKKIIYCEGKSEPDVNKNEQGLDANIYNEIFSDEYHEALFVSSGGGPVPEKNSSVALKVLNKAFQDVELYLLKDKDENTDEERKNCISGNSMQLMLNRREIENYIFDKEILKIFCQQNSTLFNENRYDKLVTDINQQDLKPIQQHIQACCKNQGNINNFKYDLAKFISKDTQVFKELKTVIFDCISR